MTGRPAYEDVAHLIDTSESAQATAGDLYEFLEMTEDGEIDPDTYPAGDAPQPALAGWEEMDEGEMDAFRDRVETVDVPYPDR